MSNDAILKEIYEKGGKKMAKPFTPKNDAFSKGSGDGKMNAIQRRLAKINDAKGKSPKGAIKGEK